MLAFFSTVSVLLMLLFIKSVYDQRSTEPYLIEVDKQTGILTTVESQTKKEYTAQEVIKEYFIVNYVYSRETYSPTDKERNDDNVRIFSAPKVYKTYQSEISKIRSDIAAVGPNAVAYIRIGSISYLTPNRVQIKFSRDVKSPDTDKIVTRKYLGILSFEFLDLQMSLEDRRQNPLGFQVSSYFTNEEKIFDDY